MYSILGYVIHECELACVPCTIEAIRSAGGDAYPPERARRITVHNRKALGKVAADHYTWPALYSRYPMPSRAEQRREAKQYRKDHGYSSWTITSLIDEALERGLVWDSSGHAPSVISSGDEFFTHEYCGVCGDDLDVPITCVRENPEHQGLERCECEDCEKNPIVVDYTEILVTGNGLRIASMAHDEDHRYRRESRIRLWEPKTEERLTALCEANPDTVVPYVSIPWENNESPEVLRGAEFIGEWTELEEDTNDND